MTPSPDPDPDPDPEPETVTVSVSADSSLNATIGNLSSLYLCTTADGTSDMGFSTTGSNLPVTWTVGKTSTTRYLIGKSKSGTKFGNLFKVNGQTPTYYGNSTMFSVAVDLSTNVTAVLSGYIS